MEGRVGAPNELVARGEEAKVDMNASRSELSALPRKVLEGAADIVGTL